MKNEIKTSQKNSDFVEKNIEFGKKFEHIDYAIVPKTHISMYLMHKYWARKPHNVVSEYISVYSDPGDIVLDPFCGSGVTPIEAVKLGRRAIGVDIDPVAIFITRNTGMTIDLKKFQDEFKKIKKKLQKNIDSFYKTKCSKCKNSGVAEAIVWKNNQPLEIRYFCSICNKTRWKDADEDDIKNTKKFDKEKIQFWVPENELIWNTRVNVHKGTKVSDLFTRRNLIALSMILHEINKIKDFSVREILKFTFSSTIAQASKLVFVIRKRGREGGKVITRTKPEVGSWATRGYWIGEEYFEINGWNCFENRFDKVLRGKEESNQLVGKYWKEAKSLDDLKKDKTILLLNQTATDLKNITSSSVDYVFTDPPYGDSVPYLELDYMWASWLGLQPNFDDEIIISDSPIRKKKSEELYANMLMQAFKEVFRVLKPNKYLTVTFHNADIGVYNSVIRSIVLSGFELDKILYQPPSRPSAKTLLAPYGSAEGDYYIRFKKPASTRKILTEKEVDMLRFEKIVIEAVKTIIAERGEPVTYNDILKSIYIQLDKEGYLYVANTEDIQKILDKYKDKEFIFIKDEGWWFKNPEKYFLHITPLQDRVEKFVIQVLRRKGKASFDEILQDIFLQLKNALTPEPSKVRNVLEEYATPTKDKKWKLKLAIETKVKEHSMMQGMLAELGKKFGFKIHIGSREQSDIYNEKILGYFTDSGLPSLSHQEQEIDVLWIKNGKIIYSFEVEYTTAITEAIVRGSYIKSNSTKRIFVIPSEREKLLFRKINAPILKDKISEQNWRFIFFKKLDEFFLEAKRSKTLKIEDFEKLFRELKENRDKQTTLSK
jgi:DNA modification methylase